MIILFIYFCVKRVTNYTKPLKEGMAGGKASQERGDDEKWFVGPPVSFTWASWIRAGFCWASFTSSVKPL
jgi:hypothetical protein